MKETFNTPSCSTLYYIYFEPQFLHHWPLQALIFVCSVSLAGLCDICLKSQYSGGWYRRIDNLKSAWDKYHVQGQQGLYRENLSSRGGGEDLLNFLHYKDHLVYFLHLIEWPIFPITYYSYKKTVLETKICVLGVLVATRLSLFLNPFS
jgi:hypothetical protein